MNQVIALPEMHRRHNSSELPAESRVAVIMEHVQRLADQAATKQNLDRSSAEFVRRVIAARSLRRRFFDSELFADPAWDILLELYALHCEQRRTSVSKLCLAAGVPSTTALRWIDKLHKDGLIVRASDPLDGRRIWVELSERGCEMMGGYLDELAAGAFPI